MNDQLHSTADPRLEMGTFSDPGTPGGRIGRRGTCHSVDPLIPRNTASVTLHSTTWLQRTRLFMYPIEPKASAPAIVQS